jgi:hypothetical protein
MSHQEDDQTAAPPETNPAMKKVYQKPAFRFERVFETRALSCGKVSITQGQCANNRKSS